MKHALKKMTLLAALMLLAGCNQPEAPANTSAASLQIATVTAITAEAKEHPVTEEIVGTLRAKRKTTVEAKISGRIQNLTVQAGDSVQAGALLVQLDVQEVQARLDQALAQREQAQRDLKRMTSLLKQQAVTQQEYDATEARERVSKAAVTEAETMLSYAKITAPFAGVVTRKLAENGDLAAPGKPLVEIEDPQSLRFEADVPETLLSHIKTGASMPIQLPSLNREVTGIVTEISPVADINSRTIRVKYDLPATNDLRTGLFGRVAIPLASVKSLRVPANAVLRRGQLEYVFVLQEGKARLRLVKTGAELGGEVEIVSGLEPGERIAITEVSKLVDGQPVTIR
jgi:RND family efflux transporter MFP subunit